MKFGLSILQLIERTSVTIYELTKVSHLCSALLFNSFRVGRLVICYFLPRATPVIIHY
jgi:hypothetical protein